MRIKSSKRGLTFSFQEKESFHAGSRYRYYLDVKQNEIIIVPDENGPYKLSRKGAQHKPLVDLRNKEIKDIIAMASYMEIEILDDKIIVSIISKNFHCGSLLIYWIRKND